MSTQVQPSNSQNPLRATLTEQLGQVSSSCTRCQRCVSECQYLKNYGDPKKIADAYDPARRFYQGLPFECSLCGLCKAVCPENVDPSAMFLEMRRETFDRGEGDYPEHGVLRAYEQKGTSKRYNWYGLPTGCDTIFFPGCALAGTRPEKTRQVFEHIQRTIPSVGIVLDCCNKQSHDLGKEEYFQTMFGELRNYLQDNDVKTVLVACPNCHKVFSEYGSEFETRTVYEFINEVDLPETEQVSGMVTVHDPCVARFNDSVQSAVRELIDKKGLQIKEGTHAKQTTLCCGEGGAVSCISPDLAKTWTEKRIGEADGRRIVTYCAGCSKTLGAHGSTSHVLDLIFEPQAAIDGTVKVDKAPLTYLNRVKLKKHFQSNVDAAVSRERDFIAGEKAGGGLVGKLTILALIIAAIVTVRFTGATEYLEQEKLRALIQGYGVLAPAIYMILFSITPVLFLPGLPMAMVGGILFGPFWGVVYALSSATIGACVAFLVSRYLARGWIESKLKSPRWRHLDEKVEKQGWKMVAFTRLIPLFPFNLLNYAFGLTRIRFIHYALATFLFMLPGCVAIVAFSSSLLDLLRGEISPTFFLGLLLLISFSLFPTLYKRYGFKHSLKIKTAVTAGIVLAVSVGMLLIDYL